MIKVDGETHKSADKESPENDSSKRVYKLKPGFVFNPLKKYPRNAHCLCGSGKKFKNCHLDLIPDAITVDEVKNMSKDFSKISEAIDVNG